MARKNRSRRNFTAEQLEVREVLSALSLMPDTVQTMLPANAASFPAVTVNVLENDIGTGMRITDLESTVFGRAEL
ncbi:MAG: hypothetical protein ACK5A1_12095, partial [Planctomyces sp.]